MCGSFTLPAWPKDLAQLFDVSEPPPLKPRYDVAPSQPVLAVRAPAAGGGWEQVGRHLGQRPAPPRPPARTTAEGLTLATNPFTENRAAWRKACKPTSPRSN